MISVSQIARTLTLAMFSAAVLTMLAGPAAAALVARYHFEDNTNDSGGNNLHGDYGSWATGSFVGGGTATYYDSDTPYVGAGKSVNLLNGTDAINLTNSALLNPSGAGAALSFAAWVKVGTGAQNHMLISRQGPSVAEQGYWLLANGPNNYTDVFFKQDTSGEYGTQNMVWDTSQQVANGGWVHVAGTIDTDTGGSGDGHARIYINGVMEGTPGNGQWVQNDPITQLNAAASRTFLGSADMQAGTLDGYMDDVAFFDHALTASEIGNIMGGDFSAYPVVPEPSSILLLCSGLLSLVLIARRRRR